jgi:hypothetical protein
VTTCFICAAEPPRDAAHRVCDECHSPGLCHICARASVARAAERAQARKAAKPKRRSK